MGQVRVLENRSVKPLAEQQARGLLENIDPDQDQKAAADEQEPAKGGDQADFASNPEEFHKTHWSITPVMRSHAARAAARQVDASNESLNAGHKDTLYSSFELQKNGFNNKQIATICFRN
jgi:hypothetical protein